MIKIDFLFVVFYGRKGVFYYREKGKRFTKKKQTKTRCKGQNWSVQYPSAPFSNVCLFFFLIYGLFSVISPRTYKRQSRQRRDAILSKLLSSLYSTCWPFSFVSFYAYPFQVSLLWLFPTLPPQFSIRIILVNRSRLLVPILNNTREGDRWE